MTKSKVSVAEALRMIDSGDELEALSVDFDHVKVEALDVMKLSKAGVEVPESVIYYDDDNIVVDEEESGGEWKRIHYDPVEVEGAKSEIKLNVSTSIQQWVKSKNIGIEELIDELLTNFYNSHKLLEKNQ